MVCRRCIAIVKDIFQSQGYHVHHVKLGEVAYQEKEADSLQEVTRLLQEEGFEILTDKQTYIVNQVKEIVDEKLIGNENQSRNFASLISDTLHMDYDTVSSLFSHTAGIKLEQYIIGKRIEKVQELLKYSQLTLTDIAFQLGYSSVHHLSNQFKKITGMSPSHFKELQATVAE